MSIRYEENRDISQMTMKEMSETERPYEKSLKYGVSVLTDAELLAIILRTGSRNDNVLSCAYRILNAHPVHKGLVGLNYLSLKDLEKIRGIGRVKALQMMCLAEISQRMSRAVHKPFVKLDSPESIADYYMEKTRYLEKEHVFALFFDVKHKLIKDIQISEGTVNSSLLSPRELFLEALKYEAVYVILVHNHPSGDSTPSDADLEVTFRILEAGSLIGIQLTDHIILGNNSFTSLAQRGIFNETKTK
jgi:DNA repair protein RadC